MNPTLFRAPVMAGGHLLLAAGLVVQTFILADFCFFYIKACASGGPLRLPTMV